MKTKQAFLRSAFIAMLALSVALVLAAAAPASARQLPCWRSVLNDWSDGEIDHAHPLGCYRTALERLPSDIRTYTTAEDDIQRALLDAIRARRSPTKGATSKASRSRAAASSGATTRALQGRGARSALGGALATTAPAATSPPLRAIVGASLAFLLVLLGGIGKYRERRRTARAVH